VLEDLRVEEIATLCRREGLAPIYVRWRAAETLELIRLVEGSRYPTPSDR